MRLIPLATLFFLFIPLIPASAQQTAEAGQSVVLPDSVMRQVVNGIVRWYFKPRRTKTTIPIANVGIKREWLPLIPNITFELVPENQIINFEKGVFLFENVKRTGRSFSINAGFGDLDCDASGSIWKFNVKSGSVRLWRTNETWGRGCGGNMPPTIRGLKVGDMSPNELPGYEFFKKGKLKNIRLGFSTRDDMKKLFGDTCEGSCDYDEQWRIWVNYFDQTATLTETTTGQNGSQIRTEFVPRPRFNGTLRFVRLTPKNSVSFLQVRFPRRFAQADSYVIGDSWGEDGFQGAVHSTVNKFTDGYGLSYEVFDRETFNNLKSRTQTAKDAVRKGDLLGIEYDIPDVLNDNIYLRQVK